MTMKFYKKHFLKLLDFTPEEIGALIDFAAELKAKRKPECPTSFAWIRTLR